MEEWLSSSIHFDLCSIFNNAPRPKAALQSDRNLKCINLSIMSKEKLPEITWTSTFKDETLRGARLKRGYLGDDE